MPGSRMTVFMLLALTTSACQAVDDNHLTSRDWAPRAEKRDPQPAAYWCYRTLGRPECSTTPIPGQEHRLIEGGPLPPEASPLPPRPASAKDDGLGGRLERLLGL